VRLKDSLKSHALGNETVRLAGVLDMETDIKLLVMKVLQRHSGSLTAVSEDESQNNPVRLPETGPERLSDSSSLKVSQSHTLQDETETGLLGMERGFLVQDMPELERRLRLSGWKVERVGNDLRCWTGKKPRYQ
jgi:hypothetical protein